MTQKQVLYLLIVWVILCGVIFPWKVLADELDLAGLAEFHKKEAGAYAMFLDPQKQKPLLLQTDPIFKWQNLLNQGGQLGAIYVWTLDGRPEVIGTIFSQAEEGRRKIVHEFHTLANKPLIVDCPADVERQWKPRGTLSVQPLKATPAVAETAVRRLSQMRAISREFTGSTQKDSERVELRLAPQPLIRYQPTNGEVLDGALFAYLSSAAGTDPEVILLLEARRSVGQPNEWAWHGGLVRFTERDFEVSRNGEELFSSISNPKLKATIEDQYKWCHNSDDTYYVFQAKIVPELTKPATKP